MKKRRLFRISALLISLVLTLPLISGCSETKSTDSRGRMNSAAISDKVSPEWYSEKNSAVRPFGRGADYNRLNAKYQETGQRDKELTTVYEHIPGTLESFVEGKTPDRYTSLVVRGRIVGFDYHVIREYTNGEADNTEYIVTDYYVDLIETLRGVAETDGNGLIKVRVFGGETDAAVTVNLDYNFAVGNEYLFVLRLPYAPGGAATEEKGCYRINLIYSASEKAAASEERDESGAVVFKDEPVFFVPYILSEDVTSVSLSDFREYISEVNMACPIPAGDELRDAAIKAMEEYLKNGSISQESFDIYIERLDKYAEIIG